MAEKLTNKIVLEKAKKYLAGGVNSPVRSFAYVKSLPLLIKNGKGSRVYDYDGNEYIDYVLSWGASILGHAPAIVVKEVKQALNSGIGFGATNILEAELAKIIIQTIPFIKKIRFVNSGTESVMTAIRLARGFTGKNKIIKLENSYHGHADYLLAKSGSGLATLKIPTSDGVPRDFLKHTLIVQNNDFAGIDKIFKTQAQDIAAVIIEPVGGNFGVVKPHSEFIRYLRLLTKKHNSLLIFDEVVTGFRFHFGSYAQILGIEPDLICLGKIIGGGLPIGAFAADGKIMKNLAPEGKVYQASTFAGNPVVMQAGISTLKELKRRRGDYSRLTNLNKNLALNLEKEARASGVGVEVNYYGTMFSFKFAQIKLYRRFYNILVKNGIYFAPSEFETNFLSFAHSQNDIERTTQVIRKAFKEI